ncbi:sulfate transporter family-domain-containing protein [Chaetomidium leptoderma]|uniref:Sulfate transporter family-domain-containing protein n=1 Tax=Chaetomidium leptoderma TaxID=669021 RepID=A0AAN6VQX0_9PEZI|nr:sulfate transporter family-domain-containing protein [Chaetomidium leptoderma]
MSSPALGYSSWGRRRSSASSQASHEEEQPAASSPPQFSQDPSNDAKQLSSSVGSVAHREPIRSFIHGSFRGHLGEFPRCICCVAQQAPLDSAQSARFVREETAELANYFLSDNKDGRDPTFLRRARSASSHTARQNAEQPGPEPGAAKPSETIPEVSEPPSPVETGEEPAAAGPSMLTTMLRRSPPDKSYLYAPKDSQGYEDGILSRESDEEDHATPAKVPTTEPRPSSGAEDAGEAAPLLAARSRESQGGGYGISQENGQSADLEGQKRLRRGKWFGRTAIAMRKTGGRAASILLIIGNPKRWDRRALWQNAVVAPVACLPAVVVGLLLNILDALSYGMILFPLGSPIFASLGSAGISMFYVSCIISQLTFSTGSIFKGGVGSELIEVVPFFHNMAATITDIVGEDKPDAVIATTITSYALSSMLTGSVFYLMGKFKFGYLVGFIPRHILIGCIGGVGWFLVATGFEVTARMDGSLNYDLDTLKHLMQADTVPLWIIPLTLAVILFYGQSKITSKYFLPLYILAIPAAFYALAAALSVLNADNLRDGGWIFEGPPAGEPWWYFYTLYKLNQVHWGAIAQCIPAMLALTFFGILHVPINVPALALNTGEDHANLDHELKLHGYSNFISGMAGSIQNYLVYSNSLFFMRSGGNTRLAGIELAVFTFIVMLIGPSLIGYIPVMMVGVLIFDLGFELLLEAVWQPRKKLKPVEYFTVMAIVLVMGTYDFVVGIGVGILLAFMSLTFQTSRVSAVRASYSGDVVGSTVRRNPTQQHYLRQVGRQINIIKLSGYLFFGTIVGVEDRIRALITDEEFNRHPIKFLVLDLWLVTGLDYSAAEVFNTISRLLDGRGIELVISGVDPEHGLGRNLRAVGLGEDGIDVKLLPELNSALEYCENELLKTLYVNQEDSVSTHTASTANLDVPTNQNTSSTPDQQQQAAVVMLGSSPRRDHLREAARNSLGQVEAKRSTRWQSFKAPLRLMLQIFRDVSDKNEDFWFRAARYFERAEHAAGTVLFRRGERAEGFYLIESGVLRAEYDLPQGWLLESIVAGTTCGELPFFSETNRTATCAVERDCVVWWMDEERWKRLQREEPDVAQELLRISLKLTSERMSVITSFLIV